MDFRVRVKAEFDRRRERNPRYSARAFARWLGIHHSALARSLAPGGRFTSRTVQRLGARLELSPAEIDEASVEENASSIRAFVGGTKFRPDSRWIATMIGLPLDEVNRALHHLLYNRRVTMESVTTWTQEER
jgi:hypothetical protein